VHQKQSKVNLFKVTHLFEVFEQVSLKKAKTLVRTHFEMTPGSFGIIWWGIINNSSNSNSNSNKQGEKIMVLVRILRMSKSGFEDEEVLVIKKLILILIVGVVKHVTIDEL
jgi:hypothetical protein